MSLDMTDPGLLWDPYPVFNALREEGDGVHDGPARHLDRGF